MRYLIVYILFFSFHVFGQDGDVEKKDTVDSLAQDVFIEIAGLGKSLEGVNSVAKAKKAIEQSNKHADALLKLAERLKKLPRPSNEERVKLSKSFAKRADALGREIAGAIAAVQNTPQAMETLTKGLSEVGGKLKTANLVFAEYFNPDKKP